MLRLIAYMTEFCFDNNWHYYFANDRSCVTIKLKISHIINKKVEYLLKRE